jgi:hypothetical protein
MQTRQTFVGLVPLASVALLAACSKKAEPVPEVPPPGPLPAPPAPAPAPAAEATITTAGGLVDPTSPNAVELGFVLEDETSKNPKHVAGAECSNCALYGGKPGGASGPCPLFAGQRVPAGGWCTVYTKKA